MPLNNFRVMAPVSSAFGPFGIDAPEAIIRNLDAEVTAYIGGNSGVTPADGHPIRAGESLRIVLSGPDSFYAISGGTSSVELAVITQ